MSHRCHLWLESLEVKPASLARLARPLVVNRAGIAASKSARAALAPAALARFRFGQASDEAIAIAAGAVALEVNRVRLARSERAETALAIASETVEASKLAGGHVGSGGGKALHHRGAMLQRRHAEVEQRGSTGCVWLQLLLAVLHWRLLIVLHHWLLLRLIEARLLLLLHWRRCCLRIVELSCRIRRRRRRRLIVWRTLVVVGLLHRILRCERRWGVLLLHVIVAAGPRWLLVAARIGHSRARCQNS